MAGLPEPKVVATLRNRGMQIDAAVDDAVASKPASAPAAEPKAEKAITADEAAAKSAKYKADREAFDAETKKGLPKPSGLLSKLFGG